MAAIDISWLEPRVIISAIFILVVTVILFRLLVGPARLLLRLVLQIAGGMVILILFNFMTAAWGLTVGVNVINGLLVGTMGAPGLLMLVLLQLVL